MPGVVIHLAVAKEYLKKQSLTDKMRLFEGSLAPDDAENPATTHHSSLDFHNDALSFLNGKINIYETLSNFDLNTDYGRGYFLHLITDYEYYNLVKRQRDYSCMPYRELKDSLHHDYNVTTSHFKEKYDIVLPDYLKRFDSELEGDPVALSLEQYDDFVKRMGEINLEEYYRALLNEKPNKSRK
jgi:hypothetical protein